MFVFSFLEASSKHFELSLLRWEIPKIIWGLCVFEKKIGTQSGILKKDISHWYFDVWCFDFWILTYNHLKECLKIQDSGNYLIPNQRAITL